jgi:hypothetical protein
VAFTSDGTIGSVTGLLVLPLEEGDFFVAEVADDKFGAQGCGQFATKRVLFADEAGHVLAVAAASLALAVEFC